MPERPAINASPLILLSNAGLLDLLREVATAEIVVPAAVEREIQQYGETDITVRALAETDWLIVVETPAVPEIIQACRVDPGESAVLTWGFSHPGTEVILDDLAARRCAISLGIPVQGTLGIVIKARQKGIIQAARPIIEQLRQSGMYLSDRVMNQALAVVGE